MCEICSMSVVINPCFSDAVFLPKFWQEREEGGTLGDYIQIVFFNI